MPAQDLAISGLHRIISILKEWGICIIGFTGGEPLLRTDTDEIIHQYADYFSFIIFTSGYGLSESRANKLKENGLWTIAISLDDDNKIKNDHARGFQGAYDISLQAIANAKKAGLYTVVQSVITREMINQDRIDHFLSHVKALDPDEVLLLEPLATGSLITNNSNTFLTYEERSMLRHLHGRAGHDYCLPKIHSFAHIEHPSHYGCGAGIQHAYIDSLGNFWPCNFLPISLGNILNEPEKVYERNLRYFGRPCNTCILMEDRQEIIKLFQGNLPIPFEQAQFYLEKRLENIKIKDGALPAFYKLMRS